MNISTRKLALTGATVVVATGAFDLANGNKLFKASISLFDNPAFKWGAILTAVFSAIAGTIYLLASKNALKRKVTEYGEVSFVVVNGKPRRYKRFKRKGQLVIRRAGQAKNVIPKLRDQVTASWLPDILTVRNLDGMYRQRVLKYDLSIEYSLPEPSDDAAVEALAGMVFGFRDRNRYNEESGTFEQHLENRCNEAISALFGQVSQDLNGLPVIVPDDINWIEQVKFSDTVKLATLRVSVLNLRFPQQLEFFQERELT